jgi:hypothetical protein
MPFDALKRSNVVVLPPAPPEDGGEPPWSIRIRIDIVDRRASPRRRSPISLLWWLLALLPFLGGAHAQAANWLSRTQGIVFGPQRGAGL